VENKDAALRRLPMLHQFPIRMGKVMRLENSRGNNNLMHANILYKEVTSKVIFAGKTVRR